MLQTDVFAVLSMNKLKNLTNVVIGKLGKLVHKRNIWNNWFLFLHSYSGEGQGATPEYSCRKRNLLYPIQVISFVSLVLYLIHTYNNTVDSRYLKFDGTMEKIRVNRSSTQEELRRYRKCSLFNNERETTRAKFWRAKTSIACPYSRSDFKHIWCFCCCFFSLC